MQKVLTAAQMREVDRLTTERYGIPSILLMENAAHAVARVITEKLGDSVRDKSILILCGPGNNGGDGAALARILWQQGANIELNLLFPSEGMKGDALQNVQILKKLHQDQIPFVDAGFMWSEAVDHRVYFDRLDPFLGPDVIVDAIFGTGLTKPLTVDFGLLTKLFKSAKDKYGKRPLFVSIDLPSGIDCDKSQLIGEAFQADVTVTFTRPKPANVLPPVNRNMGELWIEPIGSPRALIDEQSSQLFLADVHDAKKWLKATLFSDVSYKNKRGHAIVIAGSESYSGAAVLAGDAAMRSGVGLVTIATPRSSKDSVAARVLPEVMVRGVEETENGAISESAFDEIKDLLDKPDSVAIGSGISQDESTRSFVLKVLDRRTAPVIVDADGLNLISPFTENHPVGEAPTPLLRKEGSSEQPPPLILTPHEGEFLRLLGTKDKNVLKDRVAAVRDFATKHKVILVLKGERVLIGEPGGKVVVNPTGNSGVGKAGNGDTLTGILAGFVAQAVQMRIDIFETVVAAVYVAGMAADVAEKKYGKRVMTASDVRECLTDVFEELAGN